MGLYILEAHTDKRKWLTDNGATQMNEPAYQHPDSGQMTVAWVDNGPFQAVAIIFSPKEMTRFLNGRPDALFFSIPTETLKTEVHPTVWKDL